MTHLMRDAYRDTVQQALDRAPVIARFDGDLIYRRVVGINDLTQFCREKKIEVQRHRFGFRSGFLICGLGLTLASSVLPSHGPDRWTTTEAGDVTLHGVPRNEDAMTKMETVAEVLLRVSWTDAAGQSQSDAATTGQLTEVLANIAAQGGQLEYISRLEPLPNEVPT